MKKLAAIQNGLKAPKGQVNKFGNYNYRSCEDILEAVKPLLWANGCTLTISDELVQIGDRYYVKATVVLKDTETNEQESVTAYAREEESKKGMDGSQITGASSSYARKYALNGLFAIDDAKDSDATNDGSDKAKNEPVKVTKEDKPRPLAYEKQKELMKLANDAKADIKTILAYYDVSSFAEMDDIKYAKCKAQLLKKMG